MASSNLKTDLKYPIAIVGMGLSGQATLRLLLTLGVERRHILTLDSKLDSKGEADFQSVTDLLAAHPATLVVSPGVPLQTPWIQSFKKAGGQVTSELELAFNLLTTERIIGVTGSIGKSTVTSLIGAGLDKAGLSAFIGGNLGFPLATYVTEKKMGHRKAAEWIVLELSSYQLENFPSLRTDASILVSLTPNHLERYQNLDEYYETKLSLVEKTQGPCLFNSNGLDLNSYRSRFSSPEHYWIDQERAHTQGFRFDHVRLVGDHNRDNIALAACLGQILSWPTSYFEGLSTFAGLPHRLENLGQHKGVLFLNDSKATTIASVLQAVGSIHSLILKHRQSWLLLGGRDKNLPWSELSTLKDIVNLNFLFFGEVAEKALQQSGLSGHIYASLRDALDGLFTEIEQDDLVLLSPGGTSLDEFKSFEDRGIFFRKQIEKWSDSPDRPAKPG